MNTRVVLQIPMEEALRLRAEEAASAIGFSSLQELVRIFLHKLALKKIGLNFTEEIILSKKATRLYKKIDSEVENSKNLYQTENFSDLISQLQGNTVPRKLSKVRS